MANESLITENFDNSRKSQPYEENDLSNLGRIRS
ncbi:MAG: hypothetical protein KatS3mg006_1486 [Pyrinomonadaceae bacterium]|jgi:hypothetical protein|nr:MAG: hypothetical protein KatS3mg006_1486 [Pyrinomonadaceae bacterium]